MKNIYEDGNDRSNMEDISSGSAPLSDDASAKPNHLPPQNSDSLFVKAAENPQPASSQPVNPGTAMPNLTPEQIAALFGQFLSQMSAANPPAPAPAAQNNSEPPAAKQPQQPNDTGKRILYQSEDFDDRNAPEGTERFLLSEPDPDEERRKSFYDDDELFDIENQTVERSPSSVKMTDFGDSFSIAEVDIDSDDLPELPNPSVPKPKAQTPPVIRPGASGSSRTPTGSAFAPPIRQSAGQKGPVNPIYPTQPQVIRPSYGQSVNTDAYNRASFTSTDVEEPE